MSKVSELADNLEERGDYYDVDDAVKQLRLMEQCQLKVDLKLRELSPTTTGHELDVITVVGAKMRRLEEDVQRYRDIEVGHLGELVKRKDRITELVEGLKEAADELECIEEFLNAGRFDYDTPEEETEFRRVESQSFHLLKSEDNGLQPKQDRIYELELLLQKYITHVGNCEGVDFLGSCWRESDIDSYTKEEWEQLKEISNRCSYAD